MRDAATGTLAIRLNIVVLVESANDEVAQA
jgi:hypothetical protein